MQDRISNPWSLPRSQGENKSLKSNPMVLKIIHLIHERFGLIGLPSEVIPIPNRTPINYNRMPSITIPQRNIVIDLENKKEIDEKEKEKDYKDAGYKLIIVNQELTNGYEPEKVLTVLEKGGINLWVKSQLKK